MNGDVRTLGIAGGTGSGKTTLARAVCAALPRHASLAQDAYYRDLPFLTPAERALVNFDHPASLELSLLAEHLAALKRGAPVAVPCYDFGTHRRRPETVTVHPAPVVVVEGILVCADPRVRAALDVAVFVDAPAELRFARRLARDTTERGRTPASVRQQFEAIAEPMHRQFVQPSAGYADAIVSGADPVELLVERVLALLGQP